jgi:hypothetical protein
MRRGIMLNRYSAPQFAIPHPKAFFIQVADDARIGEVLRQQIHHQYESFVLCGINLQPLAVV